MAVDITLTILLQKHESLSTLGFFLIMLDKQNSASTTYQSILIAIM